MEIRTRSSLPPEAGDGTVVAPVVPTLTIALSIPLPVAWPRHLRRVDPAREEVALSCIELAFGGARSGGEERRPRRVARRAVRGLARPDPGAVMTAPPTFATAMREGGWWQVAMSGLRQRTRRMYIVRLLSL